MIQLRLILAVLRGAMNDTKLGAHLLLYGPICDMFWTATVLL
jgi:hypothetical protein